MPAVDGDALRDVAFAAAGGETDALERLVAAVQDDVYRLALRMVWHPEDAKDATQEALVRIVTRVGTYRGEASFRTWAYRVAANHLVNWRKSRAEQENLTFRRFADDLHEGLADDGASRPDAALLAEEVKLGCTLGMLLCLDREHRLAYVLADVLELRSEDGAYVCDVSPTAFRQRASRARAKLRAFVGEHCGLVNAEAACRCDRRVDAAVRLGRVDPDRLLFARREAVSAAVRDMEHLHDLGSLMRSHPDYRAPAAVTEKVRALLSSGRFGVLEGEPPPG
ncbi:MAG: RNA polymerase sigma factor [Actinomycetota bacterium]|nr:RNA polymerase sigma factor [Actinomycetota bacterium]